MSVIRVENLNKSIKGKVILESLSFSVERGDCMAMLGPQGAGKTTITDFLRHTLPYSNLYRLSGTADSTAAGKKKAEEMKAAN